LNTFKNLLIFSDLGENWRLLLAEILTKFNRQNLKKMGIAEQFGAYHMFI